MRSDIIKPLVLLDVATLNLYAEYINSNGLVNTIESYYNHINPYAQKVLNEPFEALISFSEFMKDKDVGNMRHVFNRILHEVEPILRHYGKDA